MTWAPTIVGLLLLTSFASTAEASTTRTFEATYLLPSPGEVLALELEHPNLNTAPIRVGGVRIPLWPGETVLRVEVLTAPARWVALDASGVPLAHGRFCSVADLVLPSGSDELWVLPVLDPGCGVSGSSASGTVRARIESSRTDARPGLLNDGWLHGHDRVDVCGILLHDVGPAGTDRTTQFCQEGDTYTAQPSLPSVDVETCGGGLVAESAGIRLGWCGDVQAQSCPSYGIKVVVSGGTLGACGDAGVEEEFGECEPQCIWYSLTQCGPYQFDPTVYVLGLLVYACGTVHAQPPTLQDVEREVEPRAPEVEGTEVEGCRPGATGASAQAAGLGGSLCLS